MACGFCLALRGILLIVFIACFGCRFWYVVCVVCVRVCVCVWDCKNGTKLSCVCSGFLIQRHGVVLGIGSDVRGY